MYGQLFQPAAPPVAQFAAELFPIKYNMDQSQ